MEKTDPLKLPREQQTSRTAAATQESLAFRRLDCEVPKRTERRSLEHSALIVAAHSARAVTFHVARYNSAFHATR
jgi:hypothetical protein